VFIIPEGGMKAASPSLAEDVLSACRSKLADFKVPREVLIVEDMPRSTLEKVAKAELRKLLA
jgi:crotonobetaine/carnitine-CoA ligase